MRGGRRGLAAVLLFVLACGGDPGSGAPPASSGQSIPDTTAPVASDTGARTLASGDSVVPPSAPGPVATGESLPKKVASAPVAKPAAPKPRTPAAPKPAPATSSTTAPAPPPDSAAPAASPDSAAPVASPDSAATPATGSAPLRDQYHQAPRDTVDQVVYDGWKQYNLNCARCHGEDVLGTTIAPHLIVSVRPGGAVASKEAFVQTVCAGRPEKGMPAWCPLGLEMDKINAIHQYVKDRSEGKVAPGRPALKQ